MYTITPFVRAPVMEYLCFIYAVEYCISPRKFHRACLVTYIETHSYFRKWYVINFPYLYGSITHTSTNVQRCLQRQQDRLNIKTDVPQCQRGSETGLHAVYDFILRRLHIKDQGLLRPSCFDHVDRLPYHWKPFTYEAAIMPNRKRPFRKKAFETPEFALC